MIVCIVQARYGSTRLPGKAMIDIAGKPLLWHVLKRAQAIPGVDHVVLAIPTEIRNRELAEVAKSLGVTVKIPLTAEWDVLSRYYNVALGYPKAKVFLRITGDCPLLDPDASGATLKAFQTRKNLDIRYASNTLPGVDGLDTEVFTLPLLRQAYMKCDDPKQREHVTQWMRSHEKERLHVPLYLDYDGPKLSVDTPEDLERVRRIYRRLPEQDGYVAMSFKATTHPTP